MNTQTVKLDVTKRPAVMPVIYLGQGDKNGTTLIADIYDNGAALTLTGYTVKFQMKQPHDAGYYNVTGTVSGSTATFAIDENYAASVAGVTECAYVEVLSGSTVICSTNRMRVVVLEGATEGVDPSTMYDNGLNDAISRAITAAEAAEGVVLQDVPTMTENVKGGAKLGSGLEVTSSVLSLDLVDSATGTSITADDASYLEGLTIEGKAVQNGTPTPSAPVSIQVVGPNGDDEFGIKVGNTLYPIDLQGNVLASLPDGTKDELTVDSAGHVELVKRVGKRVFDSTAVVNSVSANTSAILNISAQTGMDAPEKSYAGSSGFCDRYTVGAYVSGVATPNNTVLVNSSGFSSTQRVIFYDSANTATTSAFSTFLTNNPVTVYYKLATPTTTDLGYIDMPSIADGASISITAQVTPTITASWWARGASAIATAIKALRDDLLARIEAIETAIADL